MTTANTGNVSLKAKKPLTRLLALALILLLVNGVSASLVGLVVSHASVELNELIAGHHHNDVDQSHPGHDQSQSQLDHQLSHDDHSQQHDTHPHGSQAHHDASDHMHDIPGQLNTRLLRNTEIADFPFHLIERDEPVRAHYPFERPPKTPA